MVVQGVRKTGKTDQKVPEMGTYCAVKSLLPVKGQSRGNHPKPKLGAIMVAGVVSKVCCNGSSWVNDDDDDGWWVDLEGDEGGDDKPGHPPPEACGAGLDEEAPAAAEWWLKTNGRGTDDDTYTAEDRENQYYCILKENNSVPFPLLCLTFDWSLYIM